MLRQGRAHGYELVEQLRNCGFLGRDVGASLIYRILRRMEKQGAVTSDWVFEGSGPPRRVYRVTPSGQNYLARSMRELARTRDELRGLLEAFDEWREQGTPEQRASD